MNELKETAEYYRMGLLTNFISLEEVIAWTDLVIEAEATPDISIIEASISGSKGPEAVAHYLAKAPGGFDRPAVLRRLLGAMYDKLVQDEAQAPEIARSLYLVALADYAPDAEAESQMWYFDDAFDLAIDGIHGDVGELTHDLVNFLQQYSSQS